MAAATCGAPPLRLRSVPLLLVLLCCLVASPSVGFHMLDTVTPGGYPASNGCGITRTPGCYENRLRIAVLSFGTRAAHPSALVNGFLANMYTLKHGYDYIVERCAQSTVSNGSYTWRVPAPAPLVCEGLTRRARRDYSVGPKGRSPAINWSKHLFILKYLPFYDVVFYVDGDIMFVNHTYRIEDFLDEFLPANGTHTVAFGENCMTKNFCWNGQSKHNPPGLNGGMILVRNAPSAFAFFRDWAEAGEDGRCAQWRTNHPLEQECVALMLYRQYHEAGIVKVPDTILWKGADGTWLVHAFSSGGLAFPPEIMTRMAMRSFLYLLEQEHPSLYSKARNFTDGGMLGRGPPWQDKKHGRGMTHEEAVEAAKQPPGPAWGWEECVPRAHVPHTRSRAPSPHRLQ